MVNAISERNLPRSYIWFPICPNRAPTGLLMKRLSRQPLFPSRTFKSMEEILFCLFGRIFHGSIHFYGFKKERLDFKEWNWLVSWKTRMEGLFGGRGGGCFYWLNNKQAFCLAEIWPLSSILDLGFPGNQNDLLFEEVTFEHRGMTYYVMMYK